MNNLRSALGELAYRDLARILKGIANGNGNGGSGGDSVNSQEFKVFNIELDSNGDPASLLVEVTGGPWVLYTDATFADNVSDDKRQETLERIEANKTFANSILDAVNSGYFVCISYKKTYSDSNIVEYNNLGSYGYGYEEGIFCLLDSGENAVFTIPVNIENNKLVLGEYAVHIES